MRAALERVAALTSFFGPSCRTVIAALLLTFVFARAAIGPVLLARPPVDELTWVERALMPQWTPQSKTLDAEKDPFKTFGGQYYYAIHHPTVVRLIYRWVLHSGGFYDAPEKQYDYRLGYEGNLARGNYLPAPMRVRLRFTNAVFVWGAVMLFYFGFLKISSRPILACLAALPIACEPALVNALNSVVGYIGSDAVLLFMTALFWFAWLYVKDAGFAGIVLLGILAGLTVSTKYNGALVLIAAIAYYAVFMRGWHRFVWPLSLGAIATWVFITLNPIYTVEGLRWAWQVFHDTIGILSQMQAAAAQSGDYINSRTELTLALFPYVPFALLIIALVLDARREWWFGPTALWSLLVIAGNLAVIMVFLPTYAAPMRVALTVLVMAAALTKLRQIPVAGLSAAVGQPRDPLSASSETSAPPAAKASGLSPAAALVAAPVMALSSVLVSHLPTPLVSAALVLVVAACCGVIVRGIVSTAAVVLPLALMLPWGDRPDVTPMIAFSLAAALMWFLLLQTRRGSSSERNVALATLFSPIAVAYSPHAIVLLALVAAFFIVRPGGTSRARMVASLLAPALFVLAARLVFTGDSLPSLRDLVIAPRVWNSQSLVDGAHSALYSHMVAKFGQPFYLTMAALVCIYAWPLRRKWWFAPTLGGAAALFAGTLVFGGNVYFQWSVPLQMATLVPSGIVAVFLLRKAFEKEATAGAS